VYYDSRHFMQRIGKYCLLHLQDCGLANARSLLSWTTMWGDTMEVGLTYQGANLLITKGQYAQEELEVPAVVLTTAGRELFRLVQGTIQLAYLHDFSSLLHQQGCQLAFVEGIETLPSGGFKYATCTPIEPRPIQPGMPVL